MDSSKRRTLQTLASLGALAALPRADWEELLDGVTRELEKASA